MKRFSKKIVPEQLLLKYHLCESYTASSMYGFPSRKMIIIGITGTKGKTSSSEFVWSVLTAGGLNTGLIGTAHVLIGGTEIENTTHMTMPSPWITQKYLARMKKMGCTHVVLEVSSEGLKQFRHIGIAYDIAVFTNLSPEHLPSHNNSFEEYKKTKGILFKYITQTYRKRIFNKKKISIINKDSEHSDYFNTISTDKNVLVSLQSYIDKNLVDVTKNIITIENTLCHIQLPGLFNLNNALIGYAVGKECNVSIQQIKKGIENVTLIPGRMEEIIHGQNFRVFIDYAHEKLSMQNLLTTAESLRQSGKKIIVLFGAEGGGRDKQKRQDMAQLVDEYSDYAILSNVDPYQDAPQDIILDIARYFIHKKKDTDLFLLPERKEGIKKAFSLAQDDDIVLICGKGSEKTMVIGNTTIPWDERSIVSTLLKEYINTHTYA